jgi:hypothetical protein
MFTGAVVQPAQRPASSLMKTLAVMCGSTVHCMAFTRTSILVVTYALMPLTAEAFAAIGRALGRHN